MFAGPAHLERPFHSLHGEILRWHDHWLKNIDTGIMDEPPVRYWVMGANEWRSAADWPLPETQWTKFYLNSWERLQTDAVHAVERRGELPPDAFVQMPPTQTNAVQKLRYLTDPLPNDVLVVGPAVLNLFAAIDQDDTNWIITLKDVGPDVSVRSVREGEREMPQDLPERELTRGWLKASHRALDPERSKPWRPWHPLTRGRRKRRSCRARSTNTRSRSWRPPTCSAAAIASASRSRAPTCRPASPAPPMPNTCPTTSSAAGTTLHKIYHDAQRPSHLLLPIIPQG